MTTRLYRWLSTTTMVGLLAGVASQARAYPTDQYERTHIRRLPWQQKNDAGPRSGRKSPPGGQWTSDRIQLRMTGVGRDFDLTVDTPKDPELQKGLEDILRRASWKKYNVAILDITNPAAPRYAAVNETDQQTPGSVAKLLVAAGMLQELKDRFPDDIAKREAILRDTMVAADEWCMPNSHEVPVVKPDRVSVRRVLMGDTFSLWEWMDHALSPSSNAAGTIIWREATLMHLLGASYPPPAPKREPALWKTWSRQEFTDAAFSVVDKPIVDAGISPEDFNLRLFFTKGASKYIYSKSSRSSPLALVQWMLRMEQGRIVDEFSSLELKRMLYLTRRRVRYVDSPALKDSAVFFKSGSLFECVPEEGYVCGKFRGNKTNVLNAITGVETPMPAVSTPSPDATLMASVGPEPAPPVVYIVAVMSNELKRSAASDHARLATEIHQLIMPH